MNIPESLQTSLTEFKKTGFVSLPKNSLFPYQSWLQVLVGQGYLKDYKRFAAQPFPNQQAKEFFNQVRDIIQQDVQTLPKYTAIGQ